MCDHKGRVIGVLQFINRRKRTRDGVTFVPFDAEVTDLLRAVASQAAVAIQKNDLLRQISQLFESFVQASVKAIEQRDPSTSGHSFRVAETTRRLLAALPNSGLARFRDLSVSSEQLTEVRYAALLHDFGKVGVRENVLVKANKLTEERLEVIRYRFELQKERLRRDCRGTGARGIARGSGGIRVGEASDQAGVERESPGSTTTSRPSRWPTTQHAC